MLFCFSEPFWHTLNPQEKKIYYFSVPVPRSLTNPQFLLPPSHTSPPDRLNLPSVLVLCGCGISRAGDQAEIAAFCSHVVELDLSHNKLQDWREVLYPFYLPWKHENSGRTAIIKPRELSVSPYINHPLMSKINENTSDCHTVAYDVHWPSTYTHTRYGLSVYFLSDSHHIVLIQWFKMVLKKRNIYPSFSFFTWNYRDYL